MRARNKKYGQKHFIFRQITSNIRDKPLDLPATFVFIIIIIIFVHLFFLGGGGVGVKRLKLARSGAPHFHARELVPEPGPIFHFTASYTNQNLG